jgi:DNA repair protein RecN (Recombination protein N)
LIRELRVRNLAVIEELALELGPGLTVLTGETGAGKSVLLGAIALLCGRRVAQDLVREGADEASVEAIVDGEAALARARAAGLAGDDDRELLVARTLSAGGRGRVLVNGRLCTAALLGELLGDAIEVTSQGEHQELLRPELQSRLLDRFAGLEDAVAATAALHARWLALRRELEELRGGAAARARREQELAEEIAAIDAVAPKPGELEALQAERVRLRHVDRLAEAAASALALVGGEESPGERLARAAGRLRAAAATDAALEPLAAGIERARVELDESALALESYLAALEADPARLEAIERRSADLERLLRRFGPALEDAIAHRERARVALEQVAASPERTAQAEAALGELEAQLAAHADALGKRRREAAAALERSVIEELRALDLRDAEFAVRFEPAPLATAEGWEAPSGPRGRERASFLLAANPGLGARRLRETASGGELARLLLALRNVLRDAEAPRVLLFDEVDAGIGGGTARRVGERLRTLAAVHQTLCITHLPQIAALGDAHFRIVKRARAGNTVTRVEPIEGEARVEEIARMSGSGRITEATRAHARELLASCRPQARGARSEPPASEGAGPAAARGAGQRPGGRRPGRAV